MVADGAIESTPCELYGYKYLRGLRLLIAAELVRTYGIPQLRASRLAGVPQPLLNAYLNGKRHPLAVKEIEQVEGTKELVRSVAEGIVRGAVISACDLCKAVLALKGIECPQGAKEVVPGCG